MGRLLKLVEDFNILLNLDATQCDSVNEFRLKYLDVTDILNEELYDLTSKFTENLNNEMCMLNSRITEKNIEEFKNITFKLLKSFKNKIYKLNINFIEDVKRIFIR